MEKPVNMVMMRKAVCGVLNSWTALKIAVEERMGGSNSQMYCFLLVEEILATLDTDIGEISVYDIADKLSNYVDQKLNVICEDGSPEEVAADLLNFFDCYQIQDVDGFNLHINRLPNVPQWLTTEEAALPSMRKPQASTNSKLVNLQILSEELMETTTTVDEKVSPPLHEDGWTKVLNKKKRNS